MTCKIQNFTQLFLEMLLCFLFHIVSKFQKIDRNGILFPKLLWPTARKKCFSDWDFFLKFEAIGREFAKVLWSLEQFIQTLGRNWRDWADKWDIGEILWTLGRHWADIGQILEHVAWDFLFFSCKIRLFSFLIQNNFY